MDKRLIEIGTFLQQVSPFFATYFTRTTFREDINNELSPMKKEDGTEVRTIGVSINKNLIDIIYNKEFYISLDFEELIGVILHEFLHVVIITAHMQLYQNRYPEIFNYASDLIINEQILHNKLLPQSNQIPKLPEFGITLEKFNERYKLNYTKKDLFLDQIYAVVYNLAEKKHNNYPDMFDDHSRLNKDLKDFLSKNPEVKEELQELFNNAKAKEKAYGNTSGEFFENLDRISKSRINWRRKLYKAFKKHVQVYKSHYPSTTWKKLNRRTLILPSKKYYTAKVNVIIDTSGSISSEIDLPWFFAEIEKIILQLKLPINLIQFDTKITKNQTRYNRGDWKKIIINGRGGTDVQCLFDYLKDNNLTGQNIIFTDGYFSYDFDNKGITKNLWVVNNLKNTEIPYGKCLNIQIGEQE